MMNKLHVIHRVTAAGWGFAEEKLMLANKEPLRQLQQNTT